VEGVAVLLYTELKTSVVAWSKWPGEAVLATHPASDIAMAVVFVVANATYLGVCPMLKAINLKVVGSIPDYPPGLQGVIPGATGPNLVWIVCSD